MLELRVTKFAEKVGTLEEIQDWADNDGWEIEKTEELPCTLWNGGWFILSKAEDGYLLKQEQETMRDDGVWLHPDNMKKLYEALKKEFEGGAKVEQFKALGKKTVVVSGTEEDVERFEGEGYKVETIEEEVIYELLHPLGGFDPLVRIVRRDGGVVIETSTRRDDGVWITGEDVTAMAKAILEED